MRRMNAVSAIVALGVVAGFAAADRAQAQVTAYEGARLIVGDGRVIENGTVVVDGTKITQVGTAADVRVPAGANRVSLAGKTVMPMFIDTHIHYPQTQVIASYVAQLLEWLEKYTFVEEQKFSDPEHATRTASFWKRFGCNARGVVRV